MFKEQLTDIQSTPEEVKANIELLFSWALDLKKLPYARVESVKVYSLDELIELSREIDEAYDTVDKIIFEYEILVERGNQDLAREYSHDRITDAGTRCYMEITRRSRPINKKMRWHFKE
jgi:hypothetical protein